MMEAKARRAQTLIRELMRIEGRQTDVYRDLDALADHAAELGVEVASDDPAELRRRLYNGLEAVINGQ